MSTYLDHETLTPPRRKDLERLARGERFPLSRTRLRWYSDNGYLEVGPRPAPTDKVRRVARRTAVLTDKAIAAIGGSPPAERTVTIYTPSAGAG